MVFAYIKDGHNAWMGETSRGLGFAKEAFAVFFQAL